MVERQRSVPVLLTGPGSVPARHVAHRLGPAGCTGPRLVSPRRVGPMDLPGGRMCGHAPGIAGGRHRSWRGWSWPSRRCRRRRCAVGRRIASAPSSAGVAVARLRRTKLVRLAVDGVDR